MNIEWIPWNYELGTSLVRIADDREVSRYLRNFFPYPYTEEDALRYITSCRNIPETVAKHRAILVDGELAGGITLSYGDDILTGSAEIGYWLGRTFWGRGIMTETVRRVTQEAFSFPTKEQAHGMASSDRKMGECNADRGALRRISAEVFAENRASIRVLEKCGFVQEGLLRGAALKNGEIYDLVLYALQNL